MPKQRKTVLAAAGAFLAVLLVLGLATVLRPGTPDTKAADGADPPAASAGTQTPYGIGVDLARRQENDPMALGSAEAPVVLIEYADFRCPFCGVFARDTKPALMRYVEDGTLRIEFRDLPIFGDQSVDAAVAGRAAAAQGRFWQFYDAVYADAPERGHADLTRSALIGYADQAGVADLARFRTDMSSKELLSAVQADLTEAQQLGASSTPVFLVGDEPILGAQPTPEFVEKIERLAKS